VKPRFTVCLAGNPNSGKTSLFNHITGLRHHTGNYPGVTVEIKEGVLELEGTPVRFVDLPGTYNLSCFSAEETVARDFLLDHRPDLVVDVVDATNLERNMYLAVQLMEMGMPLVIALNMSDVAERQGIRIDHELLSAKLGVPVVPTVGHRGRGIPELLKVVRGSLHSPPSPALRINYGREIEKEIEGIEKAVREIGIEGGDDGLPPRWIAIKLLEGDEVLAERLSRIHKRIPKLLGKAAEARKRIEGLFRDTVEVVLAERRYGFISGACHPAVVCTPEARHRFSDKIDVVLTGRLTGIPIFLMLMYLVFTLTFKLGEIPMGWLESAFAGLSSWINDVWEPGRMDMLRSLITDGVISGVGGVLVFLPNIFILFLAISLLEDTGYMARAAFLMDRFMRFMGLQGKSFIPMLIGFGCTVPAVMATRTLESRRDRLLTILVLPLVSCGARLPVYTLVIPAFFPAAWQGPMLWTIYLVGILLAVLIARVLRSTLFKGEDSPFVMELPPYRIPTLRTLFIHAWDRAKEYLYKAGTVILAISVLLWILGNFPAPPEEAVAGLPPERAAAVRTENAALGWIGRALEPFSKPIGFDWKINTALLGAAAAKEVFVAQMGIITSLENAPDEPEKPLRDRLKDEYTPLTGLSLLIFILIASPCIATFAVVRKETGSWLLPAAQWTGLTVLAWVLSFLVVRCGILFGMTT